MSKSDFDRLAKHVEREYEVKGISPTEAKKWGIETAGKVEEEKEENKADV